MKMLFSLILCVLLLVLFVFVLIVVNNFFDLNVEIGLFDELLELVK